MLKINYMSTLFVGIDVSSKTNAVYEKIPEYVASFDPDARDEISVTVIATGLTRNSADSAEPVKRSGVQAVRQQSAAQSAADEDDVPAIQRQQADGAAASASPSVSSPRPTPMSIQDYLKNQQRK